MPGESEWSSCLPTLDSGNQIQQDLAAQSGANKRGRENDEEMTEACAENNKRSMEETSQMEEVQTANCGMSTYDTTSAGAAGGNQLDCIVKVSSKQ